MNKQVKVQVFKETWVLVDWKFELESKSSC